MDILAKGKRVDTGEWLSGCLIIDYITGKHYVHAYGNGVNETDNVGEEGLLHFVAFEVDEESICMCSGKTDAAGELVYDRDIISIDNEYYGLVFWDKDDTCFYVQNGSDTINLSEYRPSEIEVRGNTFDNPELLEARKEE